MNAPEPIAAAAVHTGRFFRLLYVSREIPGCDLYEFLEAESSAERRGEVLRAAGQLIRDLHQLGVLHSDLHPKNLFVEDETLELFVLDLDRTERGPPPSWAARIENLTRLYRFGRRQQTFGEGRAWDEDEFRILLQGYVGGDPQPLHTEVRDLYSRSAWLHRLGWGLEGAFRRRS